MLTSLGDLAVAELVFWVPATILAVVVCFRHGWGRHLGWFLIVLLGLARLIGASCTVAEDQLSTPNAGLITAAAVTLSIGLSFLISVLTGLLNQVADVSKMQVLPGYALRLLHLILIAGIILSAIGGSDLASGVNGVTKSERDNISEGETLLKAGTIMFTVGFVATVVALIIATVHLQRVPSGEKRLVLACWLSLPFVTIRLLFSLISVFAESETFNYYHPNIWARAFMGAAMEFAVATIVIVTGFCTEPISRRQLEVGTIQEVPGMDREQKQGHGYVSEVPPSE